jgi:hypothetical protein
MVGRIREKGLTPISWVYTYVPPLTGTPISHDNIYYRDYCEDATGYPIPHDLKIRHLDWASGQTNWRGLSLELVFQDQFGQGILPTSVNLVTTANTAMNNVSTARLLAQTGPMTPKVNSITNLLEIADVLRMLKHAGDLLHKLVTNPGSLATPKVIASTTLAYQFGWGPLIQDLGRVMDFADLVAQRQKELEDLYSGKGIRKRTSFGSTSARGKGSQTIASVGGITIKPDWEWSEGTKTWGTVRWKLRDPSQIGKKPSWRDAWKSVYGLNAGQIPVQIWKALPWSWAIDWFTDISNHLNALQNMVLFRPSNPCIMCTSHGKVDWKHYSESPTRKFGGATLNYSYRWRQARNLGSLALINVRVPHMDPYKLSVLGSLTVLGLVR